MKKTLFLVISGLAFATHRAEAKFVGAEQTIISTEEAKGLRDDSPVVMQGRLKKSLGDEKYLFVDSRGSIVVEIDNDDFRGIDISPADTIEIQGEVDTKMFRGNEIDVEYMEKIGSMASGI
jgi:uncharacterized protein (TIGR00156 family)